MGLDDISRSEYISGIDDKIKSLKSGWKLSTIPMFDYKRDALILYCIENNYKYESNGSFGIFTIDKGK